MIPINLALSFEQDKRQEQAIDEWNAQIDRDEELHSQGLFDGVIGDKPRRELFKEIAYRTGYSMGITQYWLNKYELAQENEFNETESIF